MIPANKSVFWEWGLYSFLKKLIPLSFEHVYIQGTTPKNVGRTLFIVNHSTWWDPLMIFLVNKKVMQSDAYAMMHEKGIKQHPIFRRIGAFSVNRDSPKDIIHSLQYAVDKLQQDKTVWIFPQGDEQPLEKRPLEFQSGVSYITEKTPQIKVVPVSLYYAFEETRKPNVYISIGEDIINDSFETLTKKEKTSYIETEATMCLDELKRTIMENKKDSFQRLL